MTDLGEEEQANQTALRPYVVLEPGSDGLYRHVAVVEAMSSTDAIRKACGGIEPQNLEGEYVAIAERNFVRLPVSIQTVMLVGKDEISIGLRRP